VESFRTVATNVCVPPAVSETVAGLTETEICDGGGFEVLEAPPQPARTIRTDKRPQGKRRATLLNMETLISARAEPDRQALDVDCRSSLTYIQDVRDSGKTRIKKRG
jgi:hypothetical protein